MGPGRRMGPDGAAVVDADGAVVSMRSASPAHWGYGRRRGVRRRKPIDGTAIFLIRRQDPAKVNEAGMALADETSYPCLAGSPG